MVISEALAGTLIEVVLMLMLAGEVIHFLPSCFLLIYCYLIVKPFIVEVPWHITSFFLALDAFYHHLFDEFY